MFDITTYNQKRSKEEFFAWLSEWSSEIATLDGMQRILRRDRGTKKIFEEALAIRKYIIQFYQESDVSVELREGNQNFDAVLYDPLDVVIEYIEVTCVPQEKDHDLRYELADKGQYSFRTRLEYRPSYLDYAKEVSAAIMKKLAKVYPTPTTLLVTLSPDLIVEEDETFDFVIKHLKPGLTSGRFSKIVIFDLPGTHWHIVR